MSEKVVSGSDVTLQEIESNDIRIIQDNSLLTWDNKKKHSDIRIRNRGASIFLPSNLTGYKAVLSKTSVVIGTNIFGWSINVNRTGTIRLGLALPTRDLSNSDLNEDLIFKQFNVTKGERIIFLLSLNKLVIERNNKEITLNTSLFTGQRMHVWVSAVPGSSMNVTIKNYKVVNMIIDSSGTARINTTTEIESSTTNLVIDAGDGGVELGAVNISETSIVTTPGEDFSATVGVSNQGFVVQDPNGDVKIDTKIKTNLIESTSSSQLVIKGGGVNSMNVDNDGNLIITPGNISCLGVKALLSGSTQLTSNTNEGVNVSSTGNVTFNNNPMINSIQSNPGNDLSLLEGTSSQGIVITNTTGVVSTNTVTANNIDSRTVSIHQYGPSIASKIEISQSGIDTEIKGNLDVANLNVTGNISVTGTVDGVDIVESTVGLVSVHSDININTPTDNDILQYDNSSSEWVNRNLASTGIAPTSHTHSSVDITDFNSAADARITLQKGNVNGLASLDGSGKIPLSQVSVVSLEYKGVWDSDTNTPALSSGSGVQGDYYVVSVPGSTNLDSITDWKLSDWAVFNGTIWEKTDNTNTVTSVSGKQGIVQLQATDITDITDVGSGSIITGVERTQINTNNSNIIGSVTAHSDVTDAGSGYIITDAERTLIGTNNTNTTGPVTVHSDVTDAGSGAIITSGERSSIYSISTTYLALLGNTVTNDINMGSNNITNVNDMSVGNDLTVNSTINATILGVLENTSNTESDIVLGTGTNTVTLSSGSSSVTRSYAIQDQGISGSIIVIPTNSISLEDDNFSDSNDASSLIVNGTNKNMGTGNGGNLLLRGGGSSGGTIGHIEIISKTRFIPQTEPSGSAGDVYYNSGTNKLRVHNGSTWIDLH